MKHIALFSRRWLPSITIAFGLIGLYLQNATVQNTREQFMAHLVADHKQRQDAFSLALWDSWDTSLTSEVRSDVKNLIKWISSIPSDNGNHTKNEMQEYRDWLHLFINSRSLPSDTYHTLLMDPPAHIRKVFLSSDSKKLSIDIDDIDRIRDSAVRFLNVMEKVAVSYNYKVANNAILDYAFKGAIVKHTISLQPFINEWRSKEGADIPDAWEPLVDLVIAEGGTWHPKGVKGHILPEPAAWERALKQSKNPQEDPKTSP